MVSDRAFADAAARAAGFQGRDGSSDAISVTTGFLRISDFTLTGEVAFDVIRQELEPVFAEVGRSGGVTIRFAHEDRQAHQNSHTFYLSYEGPLPATARPKEVKVDMTIKEEIVFPLESRRCLAGISRSIGPARRR